MSLQNSQRRMAVERVGFYRGLASVEKMEDFHFVFPWRGMAASVFSVLLIVFITMMYAVSRLKRENIIDALRDDMT